MDEIKFKSINDLYKRLKPALKTRSNELAKQKLYYTELELWNYFKDYKWSDSIDLTLSDMVEDILNTDIIKIIEETKKGEGENH